MDKKCTFTYETEANSSFLVAVLKEPEYLVQYQMRMMENNQITNLLHTRKYRQNDEVRICYNVTSHLSLSQVMSGEKMRKEDFLEILKGLAETLQELPEYQLTTCGLVLDESYIFVTPGNYTPSFVYLPLFADDDGLESLRKFIRKIVLESRIASTTDNFIQQLLDLINAPSLTPETFSRGVEKLRQANPSAVEHMPKQEPARVYVPEPQPPVFQPQVVAPVIQSDPEPVSVSTHDEIDPEKHKKGKKAKAETSKKEKGKKASKEKSGTTKESLIFTMLQAAIVLVLSMAAKGGFFMTEGGGINVSYIAGALLAVAGIDIVVYREMFINNKQKAKGDKKSAKTAKKDKADKGKKKNKKNHQTETVPVAAPVERMQPAEPVEPVPPLIPTAPAAEMAYIPVASPVAYPALSEDEDKTEVIDGDDFIQGYLEYYENGLVMRIHLMPGVTRVGSLSNKVDHVLASHKVSKIHAEFVRQGEICFVRDLNSTNGTYINGSKQRVVSNQNIQLHNGDRVRLADIEMIFKC